MRIILSLLLTCGLSACTAESASPPAAPPSAASAISVSTADVAPARAALLRYLDQIRRGDYARAAASYGGGRESLPLAWFDGGDSMTTEGFLSRACGVGLLFCHLGVRRVVDSALVPPDTIRFTLELAERDGSRFQPPPCCGSEGPPDTAFAFTVRKTGGGFVMESLPVYRP